MKMLKIKLIVAVLFSLLLSPLIGCANLAPKIKYHLEGMKDTPEYILFRGECVKNTINIDRKGNFYGKDEKELPQKECLDQFLICYPGPSQAKLEGFVKTIVEMYNTY